MTAKMKASHIPIAPPNSYADLQFATIRISHHPPTSKTVTPIIILELYRPKNNNAFTGSMMREVVEAYKIFDADDRVKVIVFTGYGKMFCAGADLSVGFDKEDESIGDGGEKDHRDGGGRVALAIHNSTKPTIGAINGSAVGIGITMTLPMVIRVVSEKAKIGFVFGRRGIVSEAGSAFFLPRLIGYSKALHLVSTGAVYPATHPLLQGLFSEVLPQDKVLSRALELAEEMAAQVSTVSIKLMRDMIWRGPQSGEEQHLLDSRILYSLFGSKDNEEGVRSFMEKRQANFQATMRKDAPNVWPWWSPTDIGPDPDKEGRELARLERMKQAKSKL